MFYVNESVSSEWFMLITEWAVKVLVSRQSVQLVLAVSLPPEVSPVRKFSDLDSQLTLTKVRVAG